MTQMSIWRAAAYMRVSDDDVRWWIHRGLLNASADSACRKVVDGFQVGAQPFPHPGSPEWDGESSARNRFVGLVTDILVDRVMAQAEMQCGPFRVVSLTSSEAVRELTSNLARWLWR